MKGLRARSNISRSAVVTLGVIGLISIALLAIGRRDFPDLHVILDTGMFLLSAMLALLLWEMGTRIDRPLPMWLAIGFGLTAILEFIHVSVTIEWFGVMAPIAEARGFLRPATWPPSVFTAAIITGAAIWLNHRRIKFSPIQVLAAIVVAPVCFLTFQFLPTYTAPGPLDITRPALILAPILWGAIAIAAWRWRSEDRILGPLALMGAVLTLGHISMLYSQAPHDTPAMVAHLGKIGGRLILLFSLMHMASLDMLERIQAEKKLADLNAELEQRVIARTAELAETNATLETEIVVRRQAEQKAQAQLERLNLLHQITRAIGERQDLNSIFQVVVRSVEDQLPVDFCCLCLYDAADEALTVARVGVKSHPLALDLAMPEQARVEIDENGLSRCVRGQVVYEPDIGQVDFPFPRRLAKGGLRSLVVSPLQVESQVFGVFVVARLQPEGFSSGECEFLRQLSEHVALAAHQSQLYGALQRAYDDLRQTQQAVMQQERLRALGQMASGIAHDINNAISPVALYTESLLESETDLSARTRGYLEIIQRAVEDVAHTVARMREFYRQSETDLQLQPVKPNLLIQQVMDLTRARWSDMPLQRGIVIELETDFSAGLPEILGVESEIREALINLIFNAVDAMPSGGKLMLRTKFSSPTNGTGGPTVEIEIADNGVGMNEDTLRRCLEPFFTTKGERGTGLGLAMVYGVMRRHGADIDIESAPGQGTTMCLRFPVPMAVPGDQRIVEARRAAPTRLRLLIIDDDPLLLKSLRDTLETEGHLVTVAGDGRSGIELFRAALARNEGFAVVITDLGMPYVDGRKVAAAIKDASAATPVILLTGWGQRLISDQDIPPHVDHILSKPPKLRELRDTLAQCC
ncbi:MAG TPA: ATP-binding protein [Dongiaceae bacterium]|nr:ATP-binding protein [Dongiaceae bacterium]